MAIAERVSDLDPRIWLNGSELARALQRPESTVYSALAAYIRASRKVGGQRRYNWTVGFELCRAYAVPLDEFFERVRPLLVTRAEERRDDPRDVLQLFEVLMRRWQDAPGEPAVTPAMIDSLWRPSGRLDRDAAAAAELLEPVIDGPNVPGPSKFPGAV